MCTGAQRERAQAEPLGTQPASHEEDQGVEANPTLGNWVE